MTPIPQPSLALQRVTEALVRRYSELRGELEETNTAALHDDALEAGVRDFKDVAGDDTRHLVEDRLSSLAASELDDVVAALARLSNGTYGLCIRCGEGVPDERLLAMPTAAMCADCQSAVEARRAP